MPERLSAALQRRVLLLAPLASLAVNMGQTTLFAILPMLGRHLDFHELEITAIISISALTFFLCSPWWGRKSDVIGRKPCILLGLAGYFIGTIVFCLIIEGALAGALTGTALYALILVYRVGHTLFLAASHPSSSAYIADVTSQAERVRGMSTLAVFIAIGAITGPVFVYFARFGFLYPLYLVSCVAAVIFFFVWRFLPALPPIRQNFDKQQTRVSYFDKRVRIYLLIGLMMFCMMAVTQQTLGFYFQDRLGLTTQEAITTFSLALMISAASTVVSQFGIARRWRKPPLGLLRLGIPIIMLSYALLALGTSKAVLFFAMSLGGIGFGLCGPGYSASCSLLVKPHEQGSLAGLAASIPGLGFVFGPIIGGGLYTLAPQYPYISASLVLLPIALYLWFGKPPQPQDQIPKNGSEGEASTTSIQA